jgi:recombination protein RecR
MKVAKPLSDVIESFRKLPGIGPKTAQRLAYYLLHVPQSELDNFAKAVSNLKKQTVLCSMCKNVSETEPCWVCSTQGRDTNTVLVVEQPLDLLAFEKIGKYSGIYHVLHGSINPLENIGPDEIYVKELIERITSSQNNKKDSIKEVILGMNPTMEGDATAMYIAKKVKSVVVNGKDLKITRLGMGIPTGADLEYADETTLSQALDGRRLF